MREEVVEAVTVAFNTPDLIINSVVSLRKYHLTLPITIINGSDRTALGVDCTRSVEALRSYYKYITVINLGYNVGHGAGLDLGLRSAKRDNVLIFDTDILVKKAPLDLFPLTKYYAMGEVVYVDSKGHNAASGIRYVHPYFALINRREYLRRPKFRNAGAPLLAAMRDVSKVRPETLIEVKVSEAVAHLERGTRKVIKLEEGKRLEPSLSPRIP